MATPSAASAVRSLMRTSGSSRSARCTTSARESGAVIGGAEGSGCARCAAALAAAVIVTHTAPREAMKRRIVTSPRRIAVFAVAIILFDPLAVVFDAAGDDLEIAVGELATGGRAVLGQHDERVDALIALDETHGECRWNLDAERRLDG